MKVTLVNSSDTIGGAAIACKRLFYALKGYGVNANLLVEDKISSNENAVGVNKNFIEKKWSFLKFALEYLFFNKFIKSPQEESAFAPAWFGHDISTEKLIIESDIINLHWINNSFLNINSLNNIFKLNKPVVWHLHDMWAFTGGCHYSESCNNYIESCGNCFFLKNANQNDLSHKLWNQKKEVYNSSSLTIVTPSRWLADLAGKSSLLRTFDIRVIPNAIDTEVFKPFPKGSSKEKLGLNKNKRYLLFAAMNLAHKRKGFEYLVKAIQLFRENNQDVQNVEMIIIGKAEEHLRNIFPYPVHFMGFVKEEQRMIDIYNAADVYINPSLQDNLPNTIMESLACGTPVVAFNTGGIPEMVDHCKNGFIAGSKSVNELAEGIKYVLTSNYEDLSGNSRRKAVENYAFSVISKKYSELFESLIK